MTDAMIAAPAESPFWTIRDMTRDFGVTMRALRFYESKGLLAPERSVPTTRAGKSAARRYDISQRRRLGLILRAKKLGFTLAEMRDMLSQADDHADDLTLAPAQVAAQMAHLLRQRTELDAAIAELQATSARLLGASTAQTLAAAG